MDITLDHVAELLSKHSHIVITAHIHPDGDSLGSMLGLAGYLSSLGKKIQLLLDDEIPSLYHFLPGIHQIEQPDSQKFKADLLVILDASDIERIGKVRDIVDAPILNIDHHISNTKFADYVFLDSQTAATGEIIFRLLKSLQAAVTTDIAICLYTAIATDCGFFRYANTSSTTMRYCAELIDYGAKPHLISEELEARPLANIINLSKILQSLELFAEGKIAILTVLPEVLDSDDNTEGFINYPRIIEGVEIAVMFKSADQHAWRVSLRSKHVDVSQIALHFGGGGHARAAGCTVNGSLANVKAAVLAVAMKHLQGLSHE